MILAADVGGTRTRVGVFDPNNLRVPASSHSVPTASISSLAEFLVAFVASAGAQVRAAAVAVAGPVVGGRSVTVNLQWSVDGRELAGALGLSEVLVLNDLKAAAYGVGVLQSEDLMVLQPGGVGAQGNCAVIAAGTGLGEAGLYWDGARHHPFATEGGHASFSPTGELEEELLRWLRRRFSHVSWERVVSGPGLATLFAFLRERSQTQANLALGARASEAEAVAQEISAERIADGARAGDPLCRAAMKLFFRLYGAEAGNLALKLMATGGVYVAGSMVVKNRDIFDSAEFLAGFCGKGRMRPLLAAIPVRVVLLEELVLVGAAVCAAQHQGALLRR